MVEQTTDKQPAAPSSAKPSKRKTYLLGLLLVAAATGIGAYVYHQEYGRFYEDTDDAYVQGNLISIAPKIAGTVTQVFADEGDYVEKGQTLVKLDPSDARIALDSAEASLANVVRQTRGLYNDVDNYQAQVQVQEVNYRQAQADYQRRVKLAKSKLISDEEVIHYHDSLKAAENQLTAVKQALNAKLALTEGVTIANHPAIKSAIAQLQNAYLNLQYTQIKAPESGYIAKRAVQVGQQLTVGNALLVVVPLQQVWIDANFKESQMADMRIGQPVDIVADLYGDDVHFNGHIASLGLGTGSAFALLPEQNATGNWIKIVRRLPVRVVLDDVQQLKQHPLRIGLSTLVTVHLKDENGPLLAQTPVTKPRFSTDIYDDQLQHAHKLVNQILQENGINLDVAVTAESKGN
ncbi:efflux RND transporter periplasmic adaptor subunit [Shewanella dokdonensis]|uniref:Efflux RND transporter periplasmic adaptor subunit n=1 Tax=Shewanella dokdonensis TaxID=712036 RepID=A0ABX8DBA9_9GAMM|nr:efflux RND transporter periplasmic adaptor subunit [Shewanella dokdonensis]MCL1075439.1 efflux RND transporter periplasmic adaptor subunit [Shewanella dokdonensis]QVK22127.1 efflux RND transporter periplasmic adaptor subunit [Shewanella dokdonensis]